MASTVKRCRKEDSGLKEDERERSCKVEERRLDEARQNMGNDESRRRGRLL